MRELFEKCQSYLPDQVNCVKHVELVHNPKLAPFQDKDAALWNAFVEFYGSKQCPLEPCFQSCLSDSCELQISPVLPELGDLDLLTAFRNNHGMLAWRSETAQTYFSTLRCLLPSLLPTPSAVWGFGAPPPSACAGPARGPPTATLVVATESSIVTTPRPLGRACM